MPIYAFVISGLGSWYSLPGSIMANGLPFDASAHTCAMLFEPLGERVEIINADNGKSTYCIVSDRGPFVPGRVIDVSPSVRDELGFDGLANVRIYRQSGYVHPCKAVPRPQTCKTPPRACVLDLPKPALVLCL